MGTMTDRSRLLRQTETRSEKLLWSALRGRRFYGTKWRRQQKMGRFVVDFFCAARGLVVEVDGAVHDDQVDRDAIRQRLLELSGVRVVRFSATDVETRLPSVMKRLHQWMVSPSPLVGEGHREARVE